MKPTDTPIDPETALELLRTLADHNRLTIVALLGRRPHYVEELAEATGAHPATVSHHLRRLRAAGLVELEGRGIYRLYRLQPELLEQLSGLIESNDRLAACLRLPTESDLSARILSRYLDADGRLHELPRMARPRSAILRHIAEDFELGRLYPERELRHILLRFSDSTETLLAALESEGWIQRSGTVYRRLERRETP